MTKILITEFINKSSLENLNKKFDVKYDEKLYENEKQLITMVKDYDGLIVRNKTQVNSNILKNAIKSHLQHLLLNKYAPCHQVIYYFLILLALCILTHDLIIPFYLFFLL